MKDRGLVDPYGRTINYLRIAVTNRCNLSCSYCVPSSGYSRSNIYQLTAEQIVGCANAAAALGFSKIRLTGGEVFLRDDIPEIVAELDRNPNINEICITSNGTLLEKNAAALKKAGLDRINIGLDTLCSDVFKRITQKDMFSDVLRGIDAAQREGLKVKINFVVLERINDREIGAMKAFCKQRKIGLQFIKRMDLNLGKQEGDSFVYDRPPRCQTCNKIRLTSDGFLLPCLFSVPTININKCGSFSEAIEEAVNLKPKNGYLTSQARHMIDIGG